MKKIFYLMLVALTMGMFTACDDDDENTLKSTTRNPRNNGARRSGATIKPYWPFLISMPIIGNTPILTKIIQTSAFV